MSLTAWLCSSTERLFRSSAGMGIATPSPVQLAWCRLLDGVPLGELGAAPFVRESFGGTLPELCQRPEEVCLFGGIRGGKTALIASTAIRCSQTVDTSPLMRGEVFRIPIVSLTKDLAKQTYSHLRNAIEGSPVLRPLLVRRPQAESLELRHPSGHVCEVTVSAGAAAGASTAARYLGAAIFDEFPRMLGSEDGVVNWDDMRGECQGRVLDGGIVLNAGSPWAPYGPAYKLFIERFGRPAPEMVVARAKAYWLNPHWWTPERIEKYKRAPGNETRGETNIEANFAVQEESLFSERELSMVRRELPLFLPFDERCSYVAAMDPAMKRNAWTLTIWTREGRVLKQAYACQWIGTASVPLRPRLVLGEIAEILRSYRLDVIFTDQWHDESLRDLALEHRMSLVPYTMKRRESVERYQAFQRRVAEGEVELCPEPWVQADLLRVKKRVTADGISIHLPPTSDGRHCDYAPCIILAVRPWLDDIKPELPAFGTREALVHEENKIHASLVREARRKSRRYAA